MTRRVLLRRPAATDQAAIDEQLAAGLEAIRRELDVPGEHPAAVVAEAEEAARRRPGASTHTDRTAEPFRTLDPAESTDLDQAFHIEAAGDDLLLRYAIADVGWFVEPGGPLDEEAWRRGTTIYLPDRRSTLYPSALSEGAASLLPDGPRPAVVFTVRVDAGGDVHLDGAERALVHSRAKLAYDRVDPAELPGFEELSRRIVAAEDRRGAPRVEFPEQELDRTDGQWELRFRPRLDSEDDNAGMSLATNLAVAAAMHAAGTGLFRVMDEVDEGADRRLRHQAAVFGLEWPTDVSLTAFQRSLSTADPRGAAFLLAVRRAGGRARYEPYRPGETPWHAAMAATYCHATAPLRRLADRHVVEAALALAAGADLPEHVEAAFERLPETMERTQGLAARVDAAVLDLAEAVMLSTHVGDVFDGVVLDEDRRGVVVQVAEPAIVARVGASRVDPGDRVRIKLVAADPVARRVEFQRVG